MKGAERSPDQRFSRKRTLFIAGVLALVAATCILVPLALDAWHERQERMAFQMADDAVQAEIVRAYVLFELGRPWSSSLLGDAPHETLIFDTSSAALCPTGRPEPCDELEYLYVETGSSPLGSGDGTVPAELREHLDRNIGRRTWNPAPDIAGVDVVHGATHDLVEERCRHDGIYAVRLLRLSRAAVHVPDAEAIAMRLTRYCDRSGGAAVVRFHRQQGVWKVVEEY